MKKIISNTNSFSKQDKREIKSFIHQYQDNKSIALVAQGGGQLGIFTAGVLDAFLDDEYDPFSMYIGASAGALNLTSYLTRQYKYAYRFIRDITTDARFFSLPRFIRYNQGMDLDWAIGNGMQLPEYELDLARGKRSMRGKIALAATTHIDDLSAHYFPLFKDNWLDVLKATSAIPLIHSQPVMVNGELFYDGGISAAIPVKEAYKRGARVIVVIRTEPARNDEFIDKEESISTIAQFHRSFVQAMPHYLKRLNLGNHKLQLDRFHNILEGKLKALSLIKEDGAIKVRNSSQSWLFDKDSIYRIIAMTGQHIDSSFIDILIQHYQSYEETLTFLQAPPDDVLVIEIAPENTLKARALLSKKEILDNEYALGVSAGEHFLDSFNGLGFFKS